LKGHTSLLMVNSCAEKLEGCAEAYIKSMGMPDKGQDNNMDKWFNQNCGYKGKSLCSTGRIFLFLVYTIVLIIYI